MLAVIVGLLGAFLIHISSKIVVYAVPFHVRIILFAQRLSWVCKHERYCPFSNVLFVMILISCHAVHFH
jgi:hypothetical protein